MTDLYRKIYDGEIFQATQCIWHENTLMDFFRSQLTMLGYKMVADNKKVWQRGDQKVVICLVDDFITCTNDFSATLPYSFDSNTVVITDNYVTVPTQYTVLQLPPSFFGIYNHKPVDTNWRPDRQLNFSVNRLDTKRMLVFLELWNRRMAKAYDEGIDINDLDYINFNCWKWGNDNSSLHSARANFLEAWNKLEEHYKESYNHVYTDLLPKIPIRNHPLTHEQAHVSAWANVVVETYSSDTTVALSEKIFRALCLPVPWLVYSGKHTVAYLHSLGFDVMFDLIKHRYDGMIENKTARYGDKIVDFTFESVDAADDLKARDFSQVQQRCMQAAKHNQELLAKMQQDWPTDFAAWLPKAIARIS